MAIQPYLRELYDFTHFGQEGHEDESILRGFIHVQSHDQRF